MNGIEYPVATKDIDKFESLNGISINVYGFEEKIFPMRITHLKNTRHHVDLLYISKGEKNHYILIKDISGLVSRQLSKNTMKKFICKLCLHACVSQEILDKHLERCQLHASQRIRMPQKGEEKLYFTKVEYQERLPFTIYADFESILESKEIVEKDPSQPWTERYQNHIPCGFGIHTVCTDKRFYSKPKIYFGKDCAERFIDCVQREAAIIRKFLRNKVPMTRLSSEQWRSHQSATKCHICQKDFEENDQRVRDHDHLTGMLLDYTMSLSRELIIIEN